MPRNIRPPRRGADSGPRTLRPHRTAVVDASVVSPWIGAQTLEMGPVDLGLRQRQPSPAVRLPMRNELADGTEAGATLRQGRRWMKEVVQALRQGAERPDAATADLLWVAARRRNRHGAQVHVAVLNR